MTTNEKIAALLREQTYDERMELAEQYRDYLIDWIEDHATTERPDRDDHAFWLGCLAEAVIEGMDEALAA